MATIDMLFDASALLYPEYHGGLMQLTEEVTTSNFIQSVELLNSHYRFTSEQLRDCWFHVLDREYQIVMSNRAHMTQEQLEITQKALSHGIQQANTFYRHGEDWDIAEYGATVNVTQKAPKLKNKAHKVEPPKTPQEYSPVLLLRAMPQIRLQAERFYRDGLSEFLSDAEQANDPLLLNRYKSACVSRAEEYMKCLLIEQYREDENMLEQPISQYEESRLKDPSLQCKWKSDPKWAQVWNSIREARKQIMSVVGEDLESARDVMINAKDDNENTLTNSIESRIMISSSSGMNDLSKTVDVQEYRSALKKLRKGKKAQKSEKAEVLQSSKRSKHSARSKNLKKLAKKHGKLAQKRLTGLETSIENLSFRQAEKEKILGLIKERRKQSKVTARIEDEIDRTIKAGLKRNNETGGQNHSFKNATIPKFTMEHSGYVRVPFKKQKKKAQKKGVGSKTLSWEPFTANAT